LLQGIEGLGVFAKKKPPPPFCLILSTPSPSQCDRGRSLSILYRLLSALGLNLWHAQSLLFHDEFWDFTFFFPRVSSCVWPPEYPAPPSPENSFLTSVSLKRKLRTPPFSPQHSCTAGFGIFFLSPCRTVLWVAAWLVLTMFFYLFSLAFCLAKSFPVPFPPHQTAFREDFRFQWNN